MSHSRTPEFTAIRLHAIADGHPAALLVDVQLIASSRISTGTGRPGPTGLRGIDAA
jgi:hypothetical protein